MKACYCSAIKEVIAVEERATYGTLIKQIHDGMEKSEAVLLSGLTETERSTLFSLLKRVANNLK